MIPNITHVDSHGLDLRSHFHLDLLMLTYFFCAPWWEKHLISPRPTPDDWEFVVHPSMMMIIVNICILFISSMWSEFIDEKGRWPKKTSMTSIVTSHSKNAKIRHEHITVTYKSKVAYIWHQNISFLLQNKRLQYFPIGLWERSRDWPHPR